MVRSKFIKKDKMSESIPIWIAKDGIHFKFNHGWSGKEEELRAHVVDLLLELKITYSKVKVKADNELIRPTMKESLAFKQTICTGMRKKKKRFKKFRS